VKKNIIILFLSLFCSAVCAAENITAKTDRDKAYIGDVIDVQITAQLPAGAYITADQSALFKDFDILSSQIKRVSFEPNEYVLNYKIAAYKTGKLNIESVGVYYEDAGGAGKAFFTPPLSVEIIPSLTADDKDIADIKPLSKLKISRENFFIMALLFFAVLVLFIYILVNLPKKKEIAVEAEVDPRSKALEDLEKLFTSGIKEKDIRLFYYAMSGILRTYVSKKYAFDAMEMTTSEFFEAMKKRLTSDVNLNEFKNYLRVFTLARYAGFKPKENEIENSFSYTKNLLELL
jgi:hypothetical protein